MAAPTVVQVESSTWTDTLATAETTASVSWIAGDRIFVMGVTEDNGITLNTPTATGLTFAAVGSAVTASSEAWVHTWLATAAGSGSSVITGPAGQVSSAMRGIWAMVVRGSAGAGARATEVNVTDLVVSLARTGANSLVMYAAADWNAVGVGSIAWTPAGATQVQAVAHANVTAVAAHWPDQGATGSTNYGNTGLTGTRSWARIAWEILGSAGLSASIATTSESSAARSVSAAKSKAIAAVTVTDTARAAGRTKSVAIGRAATAQSARTVSGRTKTKAIGAAAEASTARAVTRGGISVSVARVSEIASAGALSARKTTATGRVSSAETARAVARTKAGATGRATATETSRAIARTKFVALARATAPEAARPFARLKARSLGRTTVVEFAAAVTSLDSLPPIVRVAEGSLARALAARKVAYVGPVAYGETARTFSVSKSHPVARGQDTGSARTVGAGKRSMLARAAEVSSARGVAHAGSPSVFGGNWGLDIGLVN